MIRNVNLERIFHVHLYFIVEYCIIRKIFKLYTKIKGGLIMPGRKPRTSRVLILVSILICLSFGVCISQSSATPSPIDEGSLPDMIVAGTADHSASPTKNTSKEKQTENPAKNNTNASDSKQKKPSKTSDSSSANKKGVSPEAQEGTWSSNDGIWYFLVNGTPHRGWLYDTDGNTYYFNNKDGSMKTGWLKKDGKRYYFDLDGIMQTGDITVDGETFHLLEDGSLEGYVPEETPTPKPKKKESDKKKKPASKKTIALTFDDGPSSFTNRLLDCLEKNNAKATFFMVGKEIENFPDEVKRMESLGCELGNHTYSHADLTALSKEEISSQIGTTDKLLYDLAGHGATVVRPPYGSINDTVRETVGTPMMLWSVDTLDWKTDDAQTIVDSVLSSAEDGAVILMHDIHKTSVDAAEIIIPKLIKDGYKLVTVHELAEAHGITMKPGIAYGAMKSDN